MPLKIILLRSPEQVDETRREVEFDSDQCSIGRASTNHLVLDDPERVLSAEHCSFSIENDACYLQDTSTNGTFLNDSVEPIGKGARREVRHNDKFRIGDYEYLINLDSPNSSASHAEGLSSTESARNDASRSDGNLHRSDNTTSFNRDGDLSVGTFSSIDFDPPTEEIDMQAFLSSLDLSKHKQSASVPPDSSDKENPGLVIQQELEALREQRAARSVTTDFTIDGRQFVTALGISHEGLSDHEVNRIAQLGGQLLKEVLGGLMRLLEQTKSIDSDFLTTITTVPALENNPLLHANDIDELLGLFFTKQSQAYKQPLDAVADGVQKLIDHRAASESAMRKGFEAVLAQFDPHNLEIRFSEKRKKGLLNRDPEAKQWALYTDYFRDLNENDNSYQRLFGEAFIRAYRQALQKIENERSSGFQNKS